MMRWLVLSLIVGTCLAVTCDSRADTIVKRGTQVESESSIAWLTFCAGIGVLEGRGSERNVLPSIEPVSSELRIDGSPARHSGPSLAALWRLIGFVVWNAEGRIERETTAVINGHVVHVYDSVADGRVFIRVGIGPPLGDPRVKRAVLVVEAKEDDLEMENGCRIDLLGRTTRVRISCSAHIDTPDPRCRLLQRIIRRIAERQAGPELAGRVARLRSAGEDAIRSGREQLDSIVWEFIREVCFR